MNTGIEAIKIKRGAAELVRYLPQRMTATAWSFASSVPEAATLPDEGDWQCMFSLIHRIAEGGQVCFSSQRCGCSGAACYFGFEKPSADAGRFLAEKEKFKQKTDFGINFYRHIHAPAAKSKYLLWQPLDTSDNEMTIEVVNLWVDSLSLSGLVTLANYDSPANDNVYSPFGSGCQSLWTLPFKEQDSPAPRCVIGCLDPAMRSYIPADVISFSMTAKRFVEMTDNISGSFLEQDAWLKLIATHRQLRE